MSQDEVSAILKARREDYDIMSRYEWEQTRLICFYNVIAFGGTKQLKQPKDLFKLPWDTLPTETKDKVLSKAEFLEKAEKIKQSLKLNNRAV